MDVSALAFLRAAHLVAALSVFGTLTFSLLLPSSPVHADLQRQLARWLRIGFLALFASLAAWLPAQAASMTGMRSIFDISSAVTLVVRETTFGRALLLRAGLFTLAALLCRRSPGRGRRTGAALLTGLALILQAWMGHAAAGSPFLKLAIAVHVAAAGAWLGALVPLGLAARTLPGEPLAVLTRRFSLLGLFCIGLIAITAAFQLTALAGGLPGLVGTFYGVLTLGKIALLAGLLAVAAFNRFVLTPQIPGPARVVRRLRISLAIEVGIGLIVILVAARMATLPPGAHEQPSWPFPVRFAVDALAHPGVRQKLLLSALALSAAFAMALTAWHFRRWRLPALAGVLWLLWLAPVPRLDLFMAPAHPAIYFGAPFPPPAASIVSGGRLFAASCAGCHGADGTSRTKPDGLRVHPTDLTLSRFLHASDGDLYWAISHGVDYPGGGLSMPGFADRFSADDIWSLVEYIRALSGRARIAAPPAWRDPIAAPDFALLCDHDEAGSLGEMRGRPVRIVLTGDGLDEVREDPRVVTVRLDHASAQTTSDSACRSDDPDAWAVYARLAGHPVNRPAGTVFLVDGQGWLRSVGGESIDTALRRIEEEPIEAGRGHAGH